MKFAKRIQQLPPYLFVEISRKIAEKKAKGEKVISFAIGDPDIPTPVHIVERLCQAARNPVNHRYPETDGLRELRQAEGGFACERAATWSWRSVRPTSRAAGRARNPASRSGPVPACAH